MCVGFVTLRQIVHEKNEKTSWNWTWKDMVVDMVWNALSIIPRVVTLALFASYEEKLFLILVVIHITSMTSVQYFFHGDGNKCKCWNFISEITLGFYMASSCLYNFCSRGTTAIHFRYYLFYWLVMFIENTVMISLWYQWSSDPGWYHVIVVDGIVIAHSLSLAVEFLHTFHCNGRKRVSEICEWYFDPGKAERSEMVPLVNQCGSKTQPLQKSVLQLWNV